MDGSIDTSFGTSGRVTTYLTEPGKRAANNLNAVGIQADGRIVGAAQTGVYDAAGRVNAKFTLVRYLGDDSLAPASLASPSSADAALLLFMGDSDVAKRRGGQLACPLRNMWADWVLSEETNWFA